MGMAMRRATIHREVRAEGGSPALAASCYVRLQNCIYLSVSSRSMGVVWVDTTPSLYRLGRRQEPQRRRSSSPAAAQTRAGMMVATNLFAARPRRPTSPGPAPGPKGISRRSILSIAQSAPSASAGVTHPALDGRARAWVRVRRAVLRIYNFSLQK